MRNSALCWGTLGPTGTTAAAAAAAAYKLLGFLIISFIS